jgi:hypothetical protein
MDLISLAGLCRKTKPKKCVHVLSLCTWIILKHIHDLNTLINFICSLFLYIYIYIYEKLGKNNDLKIRK